MKRALDIALLLLAGLAIWEALHLSAPFALTSPAGTAARAWGMLTSATFWPHAAETAKVLKAFFHAAALTGRSLDHVLDWVANPVAADKPAEILQQHPYAARFWDGLLAGALHGSPDTVGNTVTTVQQAMELFFQPDIRTRCVPSPGRGATDLAELIRRRGTVYLLGRDDPYASAAPLMTAVAEHVLDTALGLAATARHGRMTPCFLACLDELPSTTPLPTLRVRMANERALGLSFIYAAQTWKQMVVSYGEDEARSLFGLSNNLIIFGGGKDIHFYREISDLIDEVRISRQTVTDGPGGFGTTRSAEDVRVLRPGDIRRLRDRHALVVAGNARRSSPGSTAASTDGTGRPCCTGDQARATIGRGPAATPTSALGPGPRSPTPATTTCTPPTSPASSGHGPGGGAVITVPRAPPRSHPSPAPPADPPRRRRRPHHALGLDLDAFLAHRSRRPATAGCAARSGNGATASWPGSAVTTCGAHRDDPGLLAPHPHLLTSCRCWPPALAGRRRLIPGAGGLAPDHPPASSTA
jgi:hypothetical protein